MVDLHPTIKAALEAIGLPVHYEMFLHSGLDTPCISYMELTNFVERQTDITDISRLSYQIKIWDTSMQNVQNYAARVDVIMRALDFKRTSSAELHDTNSAMIQKVLVYSALAEEKFN